MSPPHPWTAEDFAAACAPFHPVPRETLQKLASYATHLEHWQAKLNLVARKSLADIWHRHFFDSAQLLPYLPATASILDLGSGGGFPGLVLAIFGYPVQLVEADQRKAGFLAAMIGELHLKARVHICRIETLAPFRVDVVTARALAPLPHLLALTAPFIRLGAKGLFLKGEQAGAELTDARESGMLFTYRTYQSLSSPESAVIEINEVGLHV